MLGKFKLVLVLLLVASMYSEPVEGKSYSYSVSVSWVYRGNAQLNNTVLTFNQLDTLNLVCRGETYYAKYYLSFMIHKGLAPTNASVSVVGSNPYIGTLKAENAGTLIFSDFDGTVSPYENFVILADQINYFNNIVNFSNRYVNIGTLTTKDSGTYHCSVIYENGGGAGFATSGGIVIQVNTKPGQAHSSRAKSTGLLAYSALLMGASKILL